MSRATGGCELATWWSGSAQLPLVCAKSSQVHTVGVNDAGVQEALGFEGKPVGGPPPVSHRYRRPAIDFLCDPTALLARLLAPEDEPGDQKETEHAGLRQALRAEQLKSG